MSERLNGGGPFQCRLCANDPENSKVCERLGQFTKLVIRDASRNVVLDTSSGIDNCRTRMEILKEKDEADRRKIESMRGEN